MHTADFWKSATRGAYVVERQQFLGLVAELELEEEPQRTLFQSNVSWFHGTPHS